MAGYLDTYGAADLKRAKITKQILLILGVAIVVAVALFLFLHNRAEKRAVRHFLDELRAGDYQAAYRDWGCTAQTPCRDYSFEKFMEDWGPKGQYANPQAGHVTTVDSCGTGVVLTLAFPNSEPFGLYVDRNTKVLSFAPWPRCPGRHWHFLEFLQKQFS